jgi:hypothetical protein
MRTPIPDGRPSMSNPQVSVPTPTVATTAPPMSSPLTTDARASISSREVGASQASNALARST